MSRTYRHVPYRVAKTRYGVSDSILIRGYPGLRRHLADVIFYAHEVEAISFFEENLAADERFEANEGQEVVGHLITGSRSLREVDNRKINGLPLSDLADRSRLAVGDAKPDSDPVDYSIASKTNVFRVYSLVRVTPAREAYVDEEPIVPYWSGYWSGYRDDWDTDSDRMNKRNASQLRNAAADFNSGVPLEDIRDDLL